MQVVARWVLAGCLVLPAVQACAEDLYGRVVAVLDGDTINRPLKNPANSMQMV